MIMLITPQTTGSTDVENDKEYIAYLEAASVYFSERSQHLEAALIVLIAALQKDTNIIFGELDQGNQLKAALKFAGEKLNSEDTLNGTTGRGVTTIKEVEKFYGQPF